MQNGIKRFWTMSECVETRNPRLKEFESYRGNHFLLSNIQVHEMRFIAHFNNLFTFLARMKYFLIIYHWNILTFERFKNISNILNIFLHLTFLIYDHHWLLYYSYFSLHYRIYKSDLDIKQIQFLAFYQFGQGNVQWSSFRSNSFYKTKPIYISRRYAFYPTSILLYTAAIASNTWPTIRYKLCPARYIIPSSTFCQFSLYNIKMQYLNHLTSNIFRIN